MKSKSLNGLDVKTLQALADCNMNVSKTAEKLFYHRNTVVFRLNRIRSKTGLNPLVFRDLVKLMEAAEKAAEKAEVQSCFSSK